MGMCSGAHTHLSTSCICVTKSHFQTSETILDLRHFDLVQALALCMSNRTDMQANDGAWSVSV